MLYRTTTYCFFLLIPLISISQDFKPEFKNIESNYIKGNSDTALQQALIKIQNLESNPIDNLLLLSRHYNLAGEIYYYLSDIGEAYNYWEKSYTLIKTHYGIHSIYIAENYSLFARYHNFKINVDSAFLNATKSIEICRNNKDSLHLIPVNEIYREYAYALKIKKEKEGYLNSRAEAKIYFDSALYFNNKYFPENITYKAQVFQDIGNLYTDNALFYKRDLKEPVKAIECFQRANNYYDKSLTIRINTWGNKHDKIATLYFVKGLSYDYCYGNDSIITALSYYQKGLCALSPEYNNTSVFSFLNPEYHFSNPALALTLLRYKIDGFYCLYQKTKDIKFLGSCYQHAITAVELWETTFKNFKTHEIHQALEVYGASPFGSIIPYANAYYQLTKNAEVKQNVFEWIDLNKYSVLLKYQLENKSISFKSTNATISEIQNKLSENEAIIEYYLNGEDLTCAVISKKQFDLFPTNQTLKINKEVGSLLLNLKKHNALDYCKTAKQLYDTILSPYIKYLSKEINHLIIIPHGKLAQIPFDALVLNQASNYSKADFLIRHFNISYALSCNLLFGNKGNNLLNSNISAISPEYKRHTNLPFSKRVIDKLKVDHFNLSDTSKSNSILHVAAHACCDYQNSRNSYILLSDNQKLFLNEISNTKLNYQLAVLNACETANGDIEIGEGVINFSRHFYLAGIKSTITTLWKVDDEATATTIETFYKELKSGNSAIKSLHDAKCLYR